VTFASAMELDGAEADTDVGFDMRDLLATSVEGDEQSASRAELASSFAHVGRR
jgi:hypothetical protein